MNESTPQRVLITGGNGFVGRHLVNRFADRGDQVTVFDVGPEPPRGDVAYVSGDIRDADVVDRICQNQDIIIHNASVVHTKQNREKDVWDINFGGTRHLAEAARKHGVGRIVYVSSASVVYDGGDIENGDESLPYPTTSQAPYADSKIAAEKMLLELNGDDIATVSIRPHVVFGPGDNRFLPAILERAYKGRLRYKVGRGDKLSDFTWVGNLVDAIEAATDRLAPGSPVAGEAYFVTNGEPMPFFDFANKVLAALDLPQVRRSVPAWLAYGAAATVEFMDTLRGGTLGVETGMTRFAVRYMCTHHYFSIDKARRDLGYEPKVSIDEGIRQTVASLRAEGRIAA
ncbi:MAG: SDR family NAD(P)-dependent oxidoreductase [Candidatus Dadabacteria bacterium]|nr:MAG: SDR family NAD(P)-dependent oxidoreductase [Candidatus Dadabacteria bacterium]